MDLYKISLLVCAFEFENEKCYILVNVSTGTWKTDNRRQWSECRPTECNLRQETAERRDEKFFRGPNAGHRVVRRAAVLSKLRQIRISGQCNRSLHPPQPDRTRRSDPRHSPLGLLSRTQRDLPRVFRKPRPRLPSQRKPRNQVAAVRQEAVGEGGLQSRLDLSADIRRRESGAVENPYKIICSLAVSVHFNADVRWGCVRVCEFAWVSCLLWCRHCLSLNNLLKSNNLFCCLWIRRTS